MDFRPDMDAHLAAKKRQYVKKKKRTKQILILLACIGAILLAAMFFIFGNKIVYFFTSVSDNGGTGENAGGEVIGDTAPPESEQTTEITTEPISQSRETVEVTVRREDIYRGTLILVSEAANRPYNFELTPPLVTLYGNKSPSYKISNVYLKLNEETFAAAEEMFNSYREETLNSDYQITEAHRTLEEQTSIYDSFIEERGEEQGKLLAALPGYSEHHSGYAFDMNVYDGQYGYSLGKAEEVKEIYGWIYENADKYGFVLRYPEGKTQITGITNEPWHFRYVGRGHASYMKENELVLEEYLFLLYKHTYGEEHLRFEFDGVRYDVSFLKFDEATEEVKLYIPEDVTCVISGENSDGVIITQIY